MPFVIANAVTNYFETHAENIKALLFLALGTSLLLLGQWLWRTFFERRLPPVVEKLGLIYTRLDGHASTTITGNYRSIPVYAFEVVTGSGQYQSTRSIFQIKLNPADVPPGLVVSREGLFSGAYKLVGGQDIVIGREKIDQKFIIQGAPLEQCQEFFDRPGVADSFLEALDLSSSFRLKDNLISIELLQTLAGGRRRLRRNFDILTRCAHAIAQTDPRLSAHPLPGSAQNQLTTPIVHPEPIDPVTAPVTPQTNPPNQQDNSNVHW